MDDDLIAQVRSIGLPSSSPLNVRDHAQRASLQATEAIVREEGHLRGSQSL